MRPTSPAAEIQQNLLPPRILRIAGAMVAGNVLPGYDIGGDWFDYAENRDCAWIGIADTEGEGAAAASLSRNKATAHVTISCWNGATSAIRRVTCGDHAPILITADGELEVLEGVLPLFGKRNLPLEPGVHERRLVDGERLILLSDAVVNRPTVDGETLGLEGVREAALKAPVTSAAGTLRAIEDAVREAVEDPLSDDATVVVIVPNPAIADVAAGE